MNASELRAALAAPFPKEAIEWRISHTDKAETKAMVLAYLTARAVMDRLDDVLGVDGWSSTLTRIEGGFVCELGLLINGIWIKRSDVAQESDIEGLKGAASGALKRAAVSFGIGRYLYDVPDTWVDLHKTKPGAAANYHKSKLDGSARYWLPPGVQLQARAKPAPTIERVEALAKHYGQHSDETMPDEVLMGEAEAQHGDAWEGPDEVPLAPPKAARAQPAPVGDGVLHGLVIGHPCPDCSNAWPCEDHPRCPTCTGPMFDNREVARGGKGKFPKSNGKAPDFACIRKKQGCAGIFWTNEWQGKCKDAGGGGAAEAFEFDDLPI
jgi:hypothetical protein